MAVSRKQRPKIAGTLCPYKGVTPDRWGKYRAQIRNGDKVEFLGHFNEAKDAARAFDRRAKQLYGRAALTNRSLGLLENDAYRPD
jgi:hypothetical protein